MYTNAILSDLLPFSRKSILKVALRNIQAYASLPKQKWKSLFYCQLSLVNFHWKFVPTVYIHTSNMIHGKDTANQ